MATAVRSAGSGPSAVRSHRRAFAVVGGSVLTVAALLLVAPGLTGASPFARAASPSAEMSRAPLVDAASNGSLFVYISSNVWNDSSFAPVNVTFSENVYGFDGNFTSHWNLAPGNLSEQCADPCNFTIDFTSGGLYWISLYTFNSSASNTTFLAYYVVPVGGHLPLSLRAESAPGSAPGYTGGGPAPLTVTVWEVISNGVPPYTYNISSRGDYLRGTASANGTTPAFTVTYTEPGVYQLNFSAADAANETTWLLSGVSVEPTPNAKVSLTANITTGPAPLTVGMQLTATATGNSTVSPSSSWIIVSGNDSAIDATIGAQNATGPSATFTYPTPGNYTAIGFVLVRTFTPNVGGGGNQPFLAYLTIHVTNGAGNGPLAIHASILAVSGTTRVAATFEVGVSGGVAPYSIEISFGDGTYGSAALGFPFQHFYATAGTFHPFVTARDGAGTLRTDALPPIRVDPGPGLGVSSPSIGTVAIDLAAVGIVGLIAATLLFVRWRGGRSRRYAADGEALVRALEAAGPRK
jgi:hypothetical protein